MHVCELAEHFGHLDILVNNAGGVSARLFVEQSERSWRRHIDINLVSMLAADVIAYADGGGKGFAFPKPVHGREKVARLLQAGAAQGRRLGVVAVRFAEINGQPGALFLDDDDMAIAAVSLDIVDRQVQSLHAVSNPEKLEHLRAMVTGPG